MLGHENNAHFLTNQRTGLNTNSSLLKNQEKEKGKLVRKWLFIAAVRKEQTFLSHRGFTTFIASIN